MVKLHILFGRINRNIVECKVRINRNPLVLITRINRNIVECKVGGWHNIAVLLICVLIETLWNVKEDKQADVKKALSVLIETLWNVKLELL